MALIDDSILTNTLSAQNYLCFCASYSLGVTIELITQNDYLSVNFLHIAMTIHAIVMKMKTLLLGMKYIYNIYLNSYVQLGFKTVIS